MSGVVTDLMKKNSDGIGCAVFVGTWDVEMNNGNRKIKNPVDVRRDIVSFRPTDVAFIYRDGDDRR